MAPSSRKGLTVDVAPGVTVTARRRSPTHLSNEAAYHKARSALLGSEVRALEKTLASGLVNFLSKQSTSPEADAREFTLQQQLTEAKIAAASAPILTKQAQDIATALTQKERVWANFTKTINARFAAVVKRYNTQRRLARTSNAMAALDAQLQINRDDLVQLGRQTKAQVMNDISRLKERFDEKKMELEKAVQAQRQSAMLQQELITAAQNKRALTSQIGGPPKPPRSRRPSTRRRSIPRLRATPSVRRAAKPARRTPRRSLKSLG